MTAPTADTPRLWTPEGFRQDPWSHAEALDAAPDAANSDGGIILPLAAFLALDARKPGRFGVLLAPAEPVDTILPFFGDLALVALAFPAFNDGRSFSKAELLRRHGYEGVLRAVGDVLIDQIPLMLRTGFTEFEVKNRTALARLAEGRIGGLPLHYQPSAKPAARLDGSRDGSPAGNTAGYSWRRQPAA